MQPKIVDPVFVRAQVAMRASSRLRAIAGIAAVVLAAVLPLSHGARAAEPDAEAKATAAATAQAVPGFWDPRRRPERPDLSRLTVIRFLTETDYPPFNFTGPDGNLGLGI